MQIYSISEIKTRLEPIFIANGIQKAVLFGSYAKGEQTEKSDVDILIDSAGKLRGLDFFGVLEEVVVALNEMPVDLIELSQVKIGTPIYYEIFEKGVVLYER